MDGVLIAWIVFIGLVSLLLTAAVWIGYRRWEREKHKFDPDNLGPP